MLTEGAASVNGIDELVLYPPKLTANGPPPHTEGSYVVKFAMFVFVS